MADKKPAPAAGEAKKGDNKFLVIGGTLMAMGLLWSVYELNPGGMLRAETKEEIKAREDAIELEKHKARAAKHKRGGH